MEKIKQQIEQEIIDLHKLFVSWFTGALAQSDLENKLASRFLKETIFITTQGESVAYQHLMMMFQQGYGKMNSAFKIAISDVDVLHDFGEYVLVTYIEWQTTDANPQSSGIYNVRKTTALISKQMPFKWLHIHETMQPKPNEVLAEWRIK